MSARGVMLICALALLGCQEKRDPLPVGAPLNKWEVQFAMDWCGGEMGGLMAVSRKGNTQMALMECRSGARVVF